MRNHWWCRDTCIAWGRLALATVFFAALCACSERITLQSGLNDADANEIVALLNRNGIDAKKMTSKEGVLLSVKDNDISRASESMQAAGLPRRKSASLGSIFKKEGMISTPLEERIRYIHGLSAELENTLQQFDNVVTARVHVVLPERIAPGEPIQPSSAAVFVKYQPPFDEDTAVPRIRNLVASSIPGLSGEEGRAKVSVVLVPLEALVKTIEWSMVGPFYVQAASATALSATLSVAVLLIVVGLIVIVLMLLRHPPPLLQLKKPFRAVETPSADGSFGKGSGSKEEALM